MKRTGKSISTDNKRHFCANGSLLLPLAQKWRLYAVIGLLAFLVLPGLTAHKVSAYSITLEVPTKLSLTLQPDGAFRSQASETPVKITSDAFAGYTFTIKSAATDGSNALKNGDYSIKSISDVGNEEVFGMNTWGFKWSKKDGASETNYQPGPTIGTVIDATTEANAVANEYTFTLGAKVDGSIAAGNYSGSFALMVTATPVPYTISYNQNTSDSVSGMPAQQTGQSDSGQVILAAEQPQRNNYRFIGWCIAQPQTEGGVEVCRDSSPYQASDSYILTKNNDNVTLYAMWAQNDNVMQNWKGCSALAMNTQTTLVDIRDNRAYYVARLADGNCWMTENLDLFLDPDKPLTPENSDVKAIWTPPTTHATNDATWDNVTGNFKPQSYDPGDICWKGERTFTTDDWSTGDHFDTENIDCKPHDTTHYHIGNYYNYTAAVAQDDTSDHTANGASYDTSICPAGWQIPSYIGNKSYDNMINAATADAASPNPAGGYIGKPTEGQEDARQSTIHANPYYYTYSGHWRGYYFLFGYAGGTFASAVKTNTVSYRIDFNGSGELKTITSGVLRADGFQVRCVARGTNYEITYDLNDGQGGPQPNPQIGTTNENSVKLSDTAPTKDGYDFVGWCANDTTDEHCSGESYQAGAPYPLSGNTTVTLHAMWKSAGPVDLGNLGDMQSFNCSRITNVNDYGTVTDTRDNNTYRVRKLADGKCWMIDNLKIQNKTLTPADSDVSSNYTLPASSTSGFSNSNYNGDWVYIADGSGNNKVEYGGYYSWHAATAGTGTQSMSSGDATSSICPKGWRLPKGGSSGDFQALVTAMGISSNAAGSTALQNPDGPNFVLAGYYYTSSPNYQGSFGGYWSSTAYSTNYAYYLYFHSSSVSPTYNTDKYLGYSVRCIAR